MVEIYTKVPSEASTAIKTRSKRKYCMIFTPNSLYPRLLGFVRSLPSIYRDQRPQLNRDKGVNGRGCRLKEGV